MTPGSDTLVVRVLPSFPPDEMITDLDGRALELRPEDVVTLAAPVALVGIERGYFSLVPSPPADPPAPLPAAIMERCRFIRVKDNDKAALDDKWETENNFPWDSSAIEIHRSFHKNYGIMPAGGICALDIDNLEIWKKLGIFQVFEKGYLVRSGRDGGGYHAWIICEDAPAEKILLYDPDDLDTKDHIGDFRGSGSPFFLVGPGSIHPSGKPYTSDNGADLLVFTWDELKRILSPMIRERPKIETEIPARSKYRTTITDAYTLRVEDFLMPDNAVPLGEFLQGAHPIHGSEKGMNLSVNVREGYWHCFRCDSGGDAALAAAVRYGLLSCQDARSGALTPEISRELVKKLEENGYKPKKTGQQPKTAPGVRPGKREHPRLTVNLEDDNFVSIYMKYAGLNKAPYPDYHHGSAVFLLSVAANRSCRIESAARDIYPNIWAFGLGDSSIAHKSDAMEYPLQHVRVSYPDTELPGHWSAAGLFQELSLKPRGYLIKDECASILSNINNNREAGAARDLLMQIYDCPEHISKTLAKKRGGEPTSWNIEKAYASFYWMTTPDNFSKNTTALDVNSGYLLRFLYYYPNYKKKPVPFSFKSGKKDDLAKKVYERFKEIREKLEQKEEFIFTLSPDGEKYFQEWQIRKETEIQENQQGTESKVFIRLLIYALKLSMLYTIGSAGFLDEIWNKPGKPVEIPIQYIIEAIRNIEEYFLPMSRIVIEMVERDASVNVQDRIRAKLQEDGECDRSTLLKQARVKAKDFGEHLSTMIESEEIIEYPKEVIGENGQKYQKTYYALMGA
jgi:hypothetical protein